MKIAHNLIPPDDFYVLERLNNTKRKTAISSIYTGKVKPIQGALVQECQAYFREMVFQSDLIAAIQSPILLIGLAESGLLFAKLMHMGLSNLGITANLIVSSRRSIGGRSFLEKHSHSPQHQIRLPKGLYAEVWVVDDEITTGQTILNLLNLLIPSSQATTVRIFSQLDIRSEGEIVAFQRKIPHVQLLNHCLTDKVWLPFTRDSLEVMPLEQVSETTAVLDDWLLPDLRAALVQQMPVLIPLEMNLEGTLLVIGEAVDLAFHILTLNPKLHLQHITLSPWHVDEKAILNRLQIGDRYYLYNRHLLHPPLYVLSDPIDHLYGELVQRLLAQEYPIYPFQVVN